MRTYCYKCPECDARFEVRKSMAQVDEQEACPTCMVVVGVRDFQAENAGPSAAVADWNKYPYVSKRLPKNLEGCSTNDKGQPVIVSKSHEREIAAKHGYRRE